MNNTIYTIALTATTLTNPSHIMSEGSSVIGNMYDNVRFTGGQEIVTSSRNADYRQYLNSIIIRQSLDKRLAEKHISLPSDAEYTLNKICEKCACFDIKEVYADYSPVSNAIRIDMMIDNDFLLIVRKTIENGEDNGVAVSLSKGDEDYIADYLDLEDLVKETSLCIKG